MNEKVIEEAAKVMDEPTKEAMKTVLSRLAASLVVLNTFSKEDQTADTLWSIYDRITEELVRPIFVEAPEEPEE